MYRDQPRRSQRRVASTIGCGQRTVNQWAADWGWGPRAAAWDAELDRRLRMKEISELEKMKARQIQLGIVMQTGAALELEALVRHIQEADKASVRTGGVRKPVVAVRDMIRLVAEGAKLERLCRDQPDAIVETRETTENLEALSVDELKAYRALREKMLGG